MAGFAAVSTWLPSECRGRSLALKADDKSPEPNPNHTPNTELAALPEGGQFGR
jgi:hypothetical protein